MGDAVDPGEEKGVIIVPGTQPKTFQFQSRTRPQFIAALVATIGSFGLGNVLGWTSPALPNLSERQDLGPDPPQGWIASIAIAGALVSGPVTAILINRFGRRMTMLLFAPFASFGWILMGLANGFPMILLGRFMTGFVGGSFTVTIPVYISETVEDRIRGTLGSAMVLMLVSGILFSYVVGAFVTWSRLSLICGFVPVLFFICMTLMPESPRYLLIKGQNVQAIHALKWLRGSQYLEYVEPELARMKFLLDQRKSEGAVSWRHLLISSVLKPLILSLGLMFFQQLGGINGVTAFLHDIFRGASPEIDANLTAIVIGIIQVLFVFVSMVIVDKTGRRILLITSDLVMAGSLIALGYFFYLKELNGGEAPESLGWLPVGSLILFVIAYSVGAGPVPWLMMGELLPAHVKGFASAIVTSFYWILAFVSTKTFEDLGALVGWHGCYWIFAGTCVLGALFTYSLVPETKGRSSEDIQRHFGGTLVFSSTTDDESRAFKDQRRPSIPLGFQRGQRRRHSSDLFMASSLNLNA